MTCDDVRDLLDQLVTDRLEPSAADRVQRHLAECSECRADAEAARFLAPRVAALPRSVPPTRPLWAGIESRLTPRRARSLLRWLPIAAVLALAVGAGWWSTRPDRPDPSSTAALPDRVPAHAAAYQVAASDLESSLLGTAKLEPVTAGALRRDLTTLNDAIQETSDALEADPGNEVLQQLHLSALRRKLDLLRRAAARYAET